MLARERLQSELGVTDDELTAVADDVERELQAVEQSALAAPFPEPEDFPEFKS